MASHPLSPARDAALDALIRAAPHSHPIRPAPPETAGLDPRDARLAEAIYRTAVQRWLTVNHLLDACLTKQMIEQPLRAVLTCGATQLLFMDRLPPHAIVNAAVEQAKARVRSGAGKLTNAVLRKVGDLVVDRRPDEPWAPADNHVPWGGGHMRLSRQAMLKRRQPIKYLSVATSHHPRLVEAWVERYGERRATDLLAHGLKLPPTLVHAPGASAEMGESHVKPPFIVWRDDHAALRAFLDAGDDRWVQDPSAYAVVEATAPLDPGCVIDDCAGRGTKTLGLSRHHPDARILATDVHTERMDDLRRVAERRGNVEALAPEAIADHAGRADLVLVDAPCTNTGVLARRPEAKYRFSRRAVDSVIATQRAILAEAVKLLAPGGTLAYSTCSLEPTENDRQVEWAGDRFGLALIDAAQRLPAGQGPTYQDGSYYALMHRP